MNYFYFLSRLPIILLYFFLLSGLSAVGQDHGTVTDTILLKNANDEWSAPKEWKYITRDNPAFATKELDDTDWKTLNLSNSEESNRGKVIWYRLHVKVDSSAANKSLVLKMRQKGASEIYLDGQLLGRIGKIDTSGQAEFKTRSPMPFNFTINDTGKHVFAIRYQPYRSSNGSGLDGVKDGIISDEDWDWNTIFDFSVQSSEKYLPEYVEQKLQITNICSTITGVFFALGFIHILLFSFYVKATYNFFFAIYNLSIALIAYCIPVSIYGENIQEGWNAGNWVIAGIGLFAFSLTGFVNNLFGKSKIRSLILLVVPIVSIILFIFEEEVSPLIIIFHLIFVFFESLYLIIRAMLKKKKAAFIVGGGIILSMLFIFIVIIANILGIEEYVENLIGGNKLYYLLFILISFPISISAYLAWQYGATNINLQKQLTEVKRLSDLSLQQEQEKQQILQNQNDILEEQVTERTAELQLEKQKSDDLLLNILPQEIADELKEMGTTKAQYHDEVTVIFTDFVSFTENSERWGAEIMLRELNNYFTAFDHIMEKHGLEKIKTIGDAYMAVCGLPHKSPDHARQTVLAALDIIQHIRQRAATEENALDIRIGIHSGSLVAGIVGVKKFAYDIWGDTVNTAARMEQTSTPGRINISEDTYQLVKDYFIFEPRGLIRAKGKGELNMYFVDAVRSED